MWSYSSGRIPTEESEALIAGLNEKMGSDTVTFYPGVSYRHICKIKGGQEALNAECTPPHDISEKPIAGNLPRGRGSDLLKTLMDRSVPILADHPVNKQRIARGDIPATMIWLFWGSAQMSRVPSFQETYGVSAAMTSGVDLLRGLAKMFSMDVISIKGVTDGPDNDYRAQTAGAIEALQTHDLVVIHIEAPDEAGHSGALDEKIEAIERIDREVIAELRKLPYDVRIMALPDHPTPVKLMTHTDEPVRLLYGVRE
jgi:2,3-bisphosphoglycerate-independent phosphoglycerate mutase